MKTCKECKVEKPIEEFYVVGKSYTSRCRPCFLVNYHRKKDATNRLDAFEGPESVKEQTRTVLKNLGYDTSKDVHKQFMVRFEKWVIRFEGS